MTYRELISESVKTLGEAGISDAEYDSFLLLEYVFNITRTSYLLKKNDMADPEKERVFLEYVAMRKAGKPVQYITGTQCFMGIDFKVSPAVLIPRFDTEILVSWILEEEKKDDKENLSILDMCTGSGCIGISLLHFNKKWQITAADISPEALEVARDNAIINNVKMNCILSDMFENITEKYDIIVSNPPYIESGVIDGLDVNVRDYEPRLALDGGEDGLDIYRRIISEGTDRLKEGGRFYFEIGYDQGESVPKLLEKAGFKNIEVRKDLAGLSRAVRAVK